MLSLYWPLMVFSAVFLAGFVALIVWSHRENREYRKRRGKGIK